MPRQISICLWHPMGIVTTTLRISASGLRDSRLCWRRCSGSRLRWRRHEIRHAATVRSAMTVPLQPIGRGDPERAEGVPDVFHGRELSGFATASALAALLAFSSCRRAPWNTGRPSAPSRTMAWTVRVRGSQKHRAADVLTPGVLTLRAARPARASPVRPAFPRARQSA